ncbi:MAG: hypothetical protein ACOVQH_06225 [Burkholderiaceae bacterium]|jgi:hypothetical protein
MANKFYAVIAQGKLSNEDMEKARRFVHGYIVGETGMKAREVTVAIDRGGNRNYGIRTDDTVTGTETARDTATVSQAFREWVKSGGM